MPTTDIRRPRRVACERRRTSVAHRWPRVHSVTRSGLPLLVAICTWNAMSNPSDSSGVRPACESARIWSSRTRSASVARAAARPASCGSSSRRKLGHLGELHGVVGEPGELGRVGSRCGDDRAAARATVDHAPDLEVAHRLPHGRARHPERGRQFPLGRQPATGLQRGGDEPLEVGTDSHHSPTAAAATARPGRRDRACWLLRGASGRSCAARRPGADRAAGLGAVDQVCWLDHSIGLRPVGQGRASGAQMAAVPPRHVGQGPSTTYR